MSCSKVEPDRTGKDFIIEFPPPPLGVGQSFDKRAAPLQFAVQVKTIRSRRRSAALSLSVAERLARDLRPAVVCILKIDDADEFVAMHLVHFKDDMLGRVLARLRAATNSARPLNRQEMSLAVHAKNRIDSTPVALKQKLASMVIDGMKSYADKKALQIEDLGFNEMRIFGTINIQSVDVQSLADGFLGLSSLGGVTMTMLERRFEIDLPLPMPPGTGTIIITPQPLGKAIVQFSNTDENVSLDVDVFVPPREIYDGGGKKIMLAWPMGRFALALEGTNNCNFTEIFQPSEYHTGKDWLAGLLASDIVASGVCSMVLTLPDGRHLMDGHFTMEPLPSRRSVIGLLRRYLETLTLAGVQDTPVRLDTLYDQRKAINETWQYLQGDTEATFGVEWRSTVELDDQDGIYITAAQLGEERVFGLAVPMSFSFVRDETDARGKGRIAPFAATIELLQEPILQSYRHFVERVSKLARYPLRIVVELVEADAGRPVEDPRRIDQPA